MKLSLSKRKALHNLALLSQFSRNRIRSQAGFYFESGAGKLAELCVCVAAVYVVLEGTEVSPRLRLEE